MKEHRGWTEAATQEGRCWLGAGERCALINIRLPKFCIDTSCDDDDGARGGGSILRTAGSMSVLFGDIFGADALVD